MRDYSKLAGMAACMSRDVLDAFELYEQVHAVLRHTQHVSSKHGSECGVGSAPVNVLRGRM